MARRKRIRLGKAQRRALKQQQRLQKQLIVGGNNVPLMQNANQLQAQNEALKFGWVGPVLSRMGNTRRWALSNNPANQVIVAQGQPLLMVHNSPADVLNAARLAVQGDSTKVIGQTVWPAVAATTTVTLTGAKVFGVRVRVSNSVLNFKFGAVNIQVLETATVRADVYVQVNQLPLDIILLTIQNANGLASIVPVTTPIVNFLLATNAALVSGDVLYAESLNMRDIGDIPNAGSACAIT